MADTSERTHGSGNRNGATTPSAQQKLPEATTEDTARKGNNPQGAGKDRDRATENQGKKGDVARGGPAAR